MTAVTTSLDEHALVELVRPCHRITSVYFGLPPEPDPERHARTLALVRRLHGDGADPVTTELIEQVATLSSPNRAPAELAVFAAAGQLPHSFHLPGLAGQDFATYSAPAHVLPLLAWLQERPPYVLVITDRTGADIHASRGGGARARVSSVQGPDDEIERNAPGGWAQPRYQNRAEDSWRHNAARVAEACRDALRDTGARLLIVSGDVRAVQLLEEHLPGGVRGRISIRHITGGRHPDGSAVSRPDRVAKAVRAAADEEIGKLVTEFAEQRGPGGLAVEGRLATLTALGQGRISTLLVVPGADAGRGAWFGPQPTQLLPDEAQPPSGWPDQHYGPLTDVAVRAALLAGAYVRLLRPGTAGAPAGGIGGLCRFR